MRADTAHAINGYAMVMIGFWSFHAAKSLSPKPDYPSLMLVMVGILLLIMSNGVRYMTKPHIYVALVLTITGIGAIAWKPLPKALDSGDVLAQVRMMAVMSTSLLALFALTKAVFFKKKKR